jgi:hypothetical protein
MSASNSLAECTACQLKPRTRIRYLFVDEHCLGLIYVSLPVQNAEPKYRIWWKHVAKLYVKNRHAQVVVRVYNV